MACPFPLSLDRKQPPSSSSADEEPPCFIIEFAASTTSRDFTMPDLRARTTTISGGGASGVASAIRSVASVSIANGRHQQPSQASTSQPRLTTTRQAMVCAGSLRVRTCKLLWKPAVLQLMVSTSVSHETDESEYEDSDSDSEDDDVGKVTTMARSNKKHHYSLVCCQRSLMGHTRRERIELDDPQEPVELSWGEDGLLSTRFEFSLMYGSAGPTGRRRTLTCRARDAKEYLQWTGALRMAVERHGKYIGEKKHKYNRSTHARTLASSKAPSQHRGSVGSFFDLNVVEEQQLQLERDAACSPTSPTAATAAEAVAPPEPDVAEESALKPVSAEVAGSTYIVPTSSARRPMSVVVQPTTRLMGTRLQRRKRSVTSSGAAGVARLRRGSITYMVTPTAPSGLNDSRSQSTATKVEETRPYNPLVQVTRPRPTHPRRRRGSSAARPLVSTPPAPRPRKISLSTGALVLPPRKGSWIPHTPDTDSSSRRRRLRLPSSPLPVLGAVPLLQASSSIVDSAVDFIDAYERPSTDFPRTTELVNSLVRIAGVSSAQQRQQLLQRQRQESQPGRNAYGLRLIPRESEAEDPWLLSRRSSKLNFDACDVEEVKSTRSRRQRHQGESWAAYLRAMEVEL
ncbi:hypothetical protein BBJ28_00019390 [Nothophytophthora sp. Chile5]|nr:hypothetical protein BBJ28_00019390 [Nothophytophthora sp. Chile5]